jgi:tetratricopeptide (TPR) repeat protein
VAEGPIIRTCKWLGIGAACGLASASAQAAIRLGSSDPARTYIQARAAAINGEHARAADLLATLAQAEPGQTDIANRALSEAIGTGRMDLALNLARNVGAAKLPTEARLLLVAEEIRRGRPDRAQSWLAPDNGGGDLSFLVPLITAWSAADRGNVDQALAAFDQLPANSLLLPLASEQRAFLLLKARRSAEAESLARQAVGAAGGREQGLRLAFADGFLAAGDRARALMIVEGMGEGEAAARQRILAGKTGGQAVDNLARAYSDVLDAFAGDLARLQRGSPPIGLLQVARYANPQNSGATALLALFLAGQQRVPEALALLRSIPPSDGLISEVRDVQARILNDAKRLDEAYALAADAARSPSADSSDFSRLGDVLQAMERHDAAAAAYANAVSAARAQKLNNQLASLLLLQASALQDANRWPEARAALQQGLAVAPDQPLLLNFLGYAQLEKGENLDSAEAMIRKATELAPDDGSIIDSLGWAEFKRGKVGDAVSTLQRAAEKDPDQADIQEHLGDALYRSGRRLEARFAWNAALVTAEDVIAARVKAKLAGGLTPANAAP